MSLSTHTYKDYKRECGAIEDRNLWIPVYLSPHISKQILGIDDGVVSLVDDGYNIDSSPTYKDSVEELSMDMLEECLMEPFLYTMPQCENTIDALTKSNTSRIVISASTYGEKNLVFETHGCIMCLNENGPSLYIPSMILKKTTSDLKCQGFTSKIHESIGTSVYSRVIVPDHLKEKCILIYSMSRLRNTTPSHTPFYSDGFIKYSSVSLIISIVLNPPEITQLSSGNGEVHIQHDKREISVDVHDIRI